jgi:hypothetical protein
MPDQQHDHKEAARTQVESQAAAAAHRVGIESQHRAVSERKQNPQFYDKFTSTDLAESEKWGHLVNEFRPWLADDHILANRRQVYRLQRELLNKVRAQQAVVGASPGARLREKPLLNALAQGVHPELDDVVPMDAAGQASIDITDPEFTPPMDSEERTVMDDVANIATARQSMGVNQAGNEALTTATTENRTVREDDTEQTGVVGSVSGVFD